MRFCGAYTIYQPQPQILMKVRRSILIFLFSVLLIGSCIYPFTPEIEDVDVGLLVIEGDIRIGAMSHIYVHYSQPLGSIEKPDYISANVWVESDKGEIISAGSFKNGAHIIDTRDLDPNNSYRLHVKRYGGGLTRVTASHAPAYAINDEYVTDWLDVLHAPELEDVIFKVDDIGEKVTFHVSTTNQDDNPYYKWDCIEDWEYTAYYNATHEFVPGANIVRRIVGANNYFCWDNDVVSKIMIASTGALKENRLVEHQIYELPFRSKKLSFLYSTEVIQSSISREAYIYWEVMSRNTEQTGGLFSPQPSEIRGNIHCVNDSTRIVVGYISASTVSSSRVFVSVHDLPRMTRGEDCGPLVELVISEGYFMRRYHEIGYRMIYYDREEQKTFWTKQRCVDCTTKGGTKDKPDFWPNAHL